MLMFALIAFGYCELASTFNVLAWRVMLVCRSCLDCFLVWCGFCVHDLG